MATAMAIFPVSEEREGEMGTEILVNVPAKRLETAIALVSKRVPAQVNV